MTAPQNPTPTTATPLSDAAREYHDCTNKRCGLFVPVEKCKEIEHSLTAARATIERQREAIQWQPIETADPKKCVLLFQPELAGRMPLAARTIVDAPMSCHHRKPTHWMPLPPAPGTEGRAT